MAKFESENNTHAEGPTMAFDRSRFLDLLAPQGGGVTLVLPVWVRANGEERVAVGAVSDGPSAKKIRDEAIKSFATSLLSGAVSHAHRYCTP